MGIKYFYNFCVSSLDDTRLDGDILSAVRKSYFDEFDKIRDKITLDSESDSLMYDYCIEKDKPLRWTVCTAQGAVLQDVSVSDGGRYYLCFYRDGRLFKRLLFSRLHTLLRAEYTDDSGAPESAAAVFACFTQTRRSARLLSLRICRISVMTLSVSG